MKTKIIKHTDVAQYLRLRRSGHKTLWVGEGKICLSVPESLDPCPMCNKTHDQHRPCFLPEPVLKPANSIPEALQMVGDCSCGEHAHTTLRKRSTQGRGRPWLVRIECASCGHWLVSIRKGSVLARIVSGE